MYFASKSHGEKIYHNQFCTYVYRIKEDNRVPIYTIEDAKSKGYRACNCCSFMGKKYREELKDISSYIKDNHMRIWIDDDEVYVETRIAAWKITSPGKSKKLYLYHANTENFRFCKKAKGKIIRTYHAQRDASSNTIIGYLKYINHHDAWRETVVDEYKKMPTSTKGQRRRYNQAKQKAHKRAVGNVLNMIEAMRVEREYRERCCN